MTPDPYGFREPPLLLQLALCQSSLSREYLGNAAWVSQSRRSSPDSSDEYPGRHDILKIDC